jgi:tRNA dimethylallyltransferase
VGATASGKSAMSVALAVALAQHPQRAEIVSVDSMQVYKGLDVASNKVTPDETQGIQHHMLSVFDPAGGDDDCDVQRFARLAVPLIDAIVARGYVPILCGGTFYWLEALLWDQTFLSSGASSSSSSSSSSEQKEAKKTEAELKARFGATTAAERAANYARLERVDPERAKRLHPNNDRKVRRSLQVFDETGVPHSEMLRRTGGMRGKAQSLRYRVAMVWMDRPIEQLDARINLRVDAMMQRRQMLEEVVQLYNYLRGDDGDGEGAAEPIDTTRGLAQALGFKEFLPWLRLSELETTEEHAAADAVLAECVAALKRKTCSYARAQLKWIKKRFTGAASAGMLVMRVDCTTFAAARRNAAAEAEGKQEKQQQQQQQCTISTCGLALLTRLICKFRAQGEAMLQSKAFSSVMAAGCAANGTKHIEASCVRLADVNAAAAAAPTKWEKHPCDVCNRVLNGSHEWKLHVASRQHKSRKRKLERIAAGTDPEQQYRRKQQKLAAAAAAVAAATEQPVAAAAAAAEVVAAAATTI